MMVCHPAKPLVFLLLLLGNMDGRAAIKTEIPELRPPKGMLEEVPQEARKWPWIAAGVCFIGAIALLWPRKRKVLASESPHARAQRELRALRGPTAEGLGDILRRYMVATFAVPGPGQTFEELEAFIAQDPRWTPERQERLRRLVDPLEFARFAPAREGSAVEPLVEEALAVLGELEAFRGEVVATPA